jgi:YD repeat-containing protein
MGRNSHLSYPDGHVRTQAYDELGRLTSRCYAYAGLTTRCYTAEYDAVGNPVAMTDPDGGDLFEYDALDRLTKVTREVGGVPVDVETYAYNALGALKLNAGVPLDDQRPRLSGGGTADAAVPPALGGFPVTLDLGGRVTSLVDATLSWSPKASSARPSSPGRCSRCAVPVCGRTSDLGLTRRSYAAAGVQRCGRSTSMSEAGCVLTRRSTSRRYSKGFTPCASQVATSV